MTTHTNDRLETIGFFVSKSDKQLAIDGAKRCGVSMSELIRRLLSIWAHCFSETAHEPSENTPWMLREGYGRRVQDAGRDMLVELLYSKAHLDYQKLSRKRRDKLEPLIAVDPFAAHPSLALPEEVRKNYDLAPFPQVGNKSGKWYGDKRFMDELVEWNKMTILERLRWDFRRINDSPIAKV
jgi:hypothetical protein